MESKYTIKSKYDAAYNEALGLIKEDRLPEAREAFRRAMECSVQLIEMSFGTEKEIYTSNARRIRDHMTQIDDKLSKPATAGGGAAYATDKTKTEEKKEQPKTEAEDAKPHTDADELLESDEVAAALDKLMALEGLHSVKEEVKKLVAQIRVQQRRVREGFPELKLSRHMIFRGNPGTGKTTVARIMADIFRALGILSKGHLVEVDRGSLVAGYVGQTAIQTTEKINEALGGILFVDEAYGLSTGGSNDFGQEAINTILKAMEDHRDDLVVIAAGYTDEMQVFLESNSGLASRFTKKITFEDYDAQSMMRIFRSMCKKSGFLLSEEAEQGVMECLEYMHETRTRTFGNARSVRNLFEKILENQTVRISENVEEISTEELATIEVDDLPALEELSELEKQE